MKFVFHTNSASPHQFPLALEIVKILGVDEYRYVYTTSRTDERRQLGWGNDVSSKSFRKNCICLRGVDSIAICIHVGHTMGSWPISILFKKELGRFMQ